MVSNLVLMIRFSKILFFLFLCCLLFQVACKKGPEYPIEPAITFKDFVKIPNNTGHDDKANLIISFTDGDGDIGLEEGDTMSPYNSTSKYYYNFFITYYEVKNGIDSLIELPFTNNSRIPVITPTGRNKAIKGDIQIELFIRNPTAINDSICFDVSICDRALHVSNVIRTPTFKIN